MTTVFTTHEYEHQGRRHTGYIAIGRIEWVKQGNVMGKLFINGPTQPPLVLLRDEPQDKEFWETRP